MGLNPNATESVFGKAMSFLSSTFKAEKGAYKKGVEKAADKYGDKISKNIDSHIDDVAKRVKQNRDHVGGKFEEKAERIAKEHGVDIDSDDIKDFGSQAAIVESLSGGKKIKNGADLKQRADSIQKKVNRSGIAEAGKSYFTDPYKTMINKEASEEARSLAKRQFVGRTGAAAAGVGAVGTMGYNTLTTGDDKDGHGRTFGGAVGNTIGGSVGAGVLGTAGAVGVSMLKKL